MSNELEEYLRQRPRWLQTAAVQLLEKRKKPTNEELNILADLCVSESNDMESDSFVEIPKGSLAVGNVSASLRIQRIENPVGINALSSKSYLDTENADIFLVYGPTGSGKSSYARLLKKACGIKTDQILRTNIFDPDNTAQSATIVYKKGDHESTINWDASGKPVSELTPVSIFDQEIARNYVSSSTEAAREPFSLRFISRLIIVSDSVRDILKVRKTILPTHLPVMPKIHEETISATFYKSLRQNTKSEVISESCTWKNENTKRKSVLIRSLGDKDPEKTLRQLNKDRVSLGRLKNHWNSICTSFSRDHLASIVKLRKKRDSTRKIANSASTKVFAGALVDGIGSETWKALWSAAKTFSETEAYPHHDFPHTEGYCVLCNQIFTKETDKRRASSFQEFVTGELETAAKEADANYQKSLDALADIEGEDDWLDRFSKLPIDEESLKSIRRSLTETISILPTCEKEHDFPLFVRKQLSKLIESELSDLDQEIEALRKAVKDDTRTKLESELKELNAKEWVSAQEDAIQTEVTRLKQIKQLDRALAVTDTSSLTIQKNKLAKSDLIGDYQDRFDFELKDIGGTNIKAAPRGRTVGKGKIVFDMEIAGAPSSLNTSDILSDGESKVIALSAFLADMSLKGSSTPFIFDDPITSLDQDYEEKVVDRLVSLSKNRQVIIFTHRLSLKTLIEESVKKESKQDSSLGTNQAPKLKISTLRTVAGIVGVVTDSSITEKSIKSAIATLCARATELGKIDGSNDYEDYSHRLTSICSDFRVLVERTIEEHLFNDVVRRFRRSIVTKDRLSKLSTITLGDATFLDKLMTQYSVFEHSQSVELPAKPPEIKEVVTDIELLRTWTKEFGSRTVEK